MAKIIGIDLGTSNTAAAVMEGGRGTIIPSAEGSSIGGKAFPSYVAFTKDGQRLVGEPARRQAIANPDGTVTAFKRKMGENYKYNLRGQEFTPQQLSAFVLQKVKKVPKPSWANLWKRPSSQYLPILTITSARPPKMRAASPAWMWCAL